LYFSNYHLRYTVQELSSLLSSIASVLKISYVIHSMKMLTFDEISAMKGNGATVRTVLKYFIDKGATVYLLHESSQGIKERYFVVHYKDLEIPLSAHNLEFFSVYNSLLGCRILFDKFNAYHALTAWNIPAPATLLYTDDVDSDSFIKEHGAIVVKPRDGAHGAGITTDVRSYSALQSAVERAKNIKPEVLIQKQIAGDDHRLLFIDYNFVAAVKRVPATITGDGVQSVRQLVETSNAEKSILWSNIRSGVENADTSQGSTSKTPVEEIIAAKGKDFLEHIPKTGEPVRLLNKANVSLGGQTYDVTNSINHELIDRLSFLLKKFGVPFCGVDVLSADITSSLKDEKSYVIELNLAPGLRLHEHPAQGQPRHVCAMIAESLIKHYRNLDALTKTDT
jgi:D-alanine-D-alanine ligase-like ATP-grasp enzyme